MNSFRYWYLKHFNSDRALEELSKPVDGNFVVVQDGPNTSVRIREEEIEGYMKYFKDKSEYCLAAYRTCAEHLSSKDKSSAPTSQSPV